jgi:aspartyl-tRNA(Asn)/glutamyl-tRNA(Gln) amidotransferase subunit A
VSSVKLGEFGLEPPGDLPDGILLCNDVFGHVRVQAAKQGLCYIRPAYGTVSRYGLIPTASSMDQIGVVCGNPAEGYDILSQIAGVDEKDGAMRPDNSLSYTNKSGVITAAVPEDAGGSITEVYQRLGAEKVKLPHYELYSSVHAILAYAELSNNISRYDGLKFGHRAAEYRGLEELYTKSRTEGFGLEAKLAAIVGGLVLSTEYYEKYYVRAMRLRRVIRDSARQVLGKYGVIVLPAGNPLAALAGLPSLTAGGVEFVADVGNKDALIATQE